MIGLTCSELQLHPALEKLSVALEIESIETAVSIAHL
jgi:hypothetical protein